MKETVIETSTNFYVSNLELGSIPPVFSHQLGRSRWLIDSEVFQTMTIDGHLKRPSVHQDRGQALIALTMIRVLAFTLTQVFFHRQVRSHFRKCSFGFCNLTRRLVDQFLVMARTNSSYGPLSYLRFDAGDTLIACGGQRYLDSVGRLQAALCCPIVMVPTDSPLALACS